MRRLDHSEHMLAQAQVGEHLRMEQAGGVVGQRPRDHEIGRLPLPVVAATDGRDIVVPGIRAAPIRQTPEDPRAAQDTDAPLRPGPVR